MSDDLESRLRRALRPVAPGEQFSARLLERVAAAERPPAPSSRSTPRRGAATWWLSAGFAASLLLALGIAHRASESQERRAGLAARRQVFEALSVTNQKLDLAYRTVLSESRDEP
jgi:hypothetical protein